MADQNLAQPVDLPTAFASIDKLWDPRIAGRVNDYDVKIAYIDGSYTWHAHDETDEFFLVVEGEMAIELEGREPVVLGPLQIFTVPRGQRHRPVAKPGTRILMFEPRGTVNTGDADVSADDPWVSTSGSDL